MQAFELRNLTDAEIRTKLEETHKELFNLRFQFTVGQIKDSNRVTALKRDIARMKTILRERELARS
jgi:large subunit ribosomal protein L29